MRKLVLKMYAFWRSFASPFIWRIFYKRKRIVRSDFAESCFRDFMQAEMDSASRMLSLNDYKPDKWKGAIDCSVPPKYAYTFFSDLKHGRDCDDWARLWALWGEGHGYEAREWIVVSTKRGEFFKRAHMVTTLSKYGEHRIVDYTPFGPHNVLDKALGDLSKRYKDGYILAEYKWKREW